MSTRFTHERRKVALRQRRRRRRYAWGRRGRRLQGWERGKTRLAEVIAEQTERCLEVYDKDPNRVLEDANGERRISSGGYHDRQLEELLQNAVDRDGGRVEVLLTRETLYVANNGAPFDEKGLLSVMASDISTKDAAKIGRFGIGLKSVLAISDTPRIFSRSVSFGFDRQWSEEMLRGEGYKSTHYPVMRLAQLLDPEAATARDEHLRELMSWASTVVVIPLKVRWERLAKRLDGFPPEFVLFSPHIRTARLRNLATRSSASAERDITTTAHADGIVTLCAGSDTRKWKVVAAKHKPSAKAMADGGYAAARDEVPVTYAVSMPPGSSVGTFWAYFPTTDETTLSGLLNAPWKLSEDRVRMHPGSFNEEILRNVVPVLVGKALVAFDGNADPAIVLDVLPARGKEGRSWADRTINSQNDSPVFEHLRRVPSLPDGNGRLRRPSELRWAGYLPSRWTDAWSEVTGAPKDRWVHSSVNQTGERRLKVRRLLATVGAEDDGNASISEWLEALVEDGTVESSAAAIRLAALIADDMLRSLDAGLKLRAQKGLANARIVRLENGDLKAAVKGRVFVRVEGDDRRDVDFVDPVLAAVPGVRDDLHKLGVVVMDRSGELQALIARAKQTDGIRNPGSVWPKIWEILREIPEETGLRILREDLGRELERVIRVRTATGAWTTPGNAFIGGAIVPVDGSRDRDRLIDPVFHREDSRLLREVGAVDAPVVRHNMPRETWLDTYDEVMKDEFVNKERSGPKPDRNKVVVEGSAPAWPMQPLAEMSETARAAATTHLLSMGLPANWTVQHATQVQYGKLTVIPPEVWFIRRYGLLRTAFGLLPPRRILQASELFDPRVLPAFEATDKVASALGLKTDVNKLSKDDWRALKVTVDQWTRSDEDDARRAEFYSWLTDRLSGNDEPEALIVRVGSRRQAVALAHVGVTNDPSVYASMIEAQVPALFTSVDEDFDRFTDPDHWGLRPGNELLQEEIVMEPDGEPVYLTDVFPPLKVRLAPEDQEVRLQPCARLVRMIATPQGQKAHPIRYRRDGDLLFVTGAEPAERLAQVSDALNLKLEAHGVAKVFQEMERRAANKRRQEVKAAKDDDERLLKSVGADAIRRIVPAQALDALGGASGGLSDREIATLARAVHGVGILKQLKGALEEAGLEPPKEWSGRRPTRQWVASLGFPTDWAGFPSADRPAVEIIDGPVDLGELHGYQIEVTRRIAALLKGIGPDRGMVSLPTGAGKTRVTVQALVDGVRDGDIPMDVPLVWIAQTDELCEQAAETWTEVWRARGSRTAMRLGRLWANRDVYEEPGSFQLVVATTAKLDSIAKRGDAGYAWLQDPSVVVIDEAHTSVATSYTTVLDWFGRSGRGRRPEDRKPLIGLTATPFRGNSKYETERLVRRYDDNRLDRGAFRNDDDSYGELQDMGVLAHVRHELIDGAEVELSESEIARMTEFGGGRLPTGVETRLGESLERTRRIADHIAQQPDDWTMLAFTPSVENARVLAALLSHRGISAVSVSADTDPAARRYYVDEFKVGRIRVITNYNILTQGFDAPKVRAVYVGRPTFSPNVYQQMIGRGLRGPKNGGLDEVLIVNVDDNFKNYGERLAFTEFEYLWNGQ